MSKPLLWTALAIVLAIGVASVVAGHIERSDNRSTTYTVHTPDNNHVLEVCPIEEGRGRCKNVKITVFRSVFRDCVDLGEANRKYTRIVSCNNDVLNGGM